MDYVFQEINEYIYGKIELLYAINTRCRFIVYKTFVRCIDVLQTVKRRHVYLVMVFDDMTNYHQEL